MFTVGARRSVAPVPVFSAPSTAGPPTGPPTLPVSVVTPVVITVRLLARPAADVIAFAKVTDFPPVDASVADFVRVTSPPYECVPEVVTSALTAVVPVINKFERPLTAPLTTASLITVKLCPAPVTVDCVVTADAVRVMSERSVTAPLYVCAPDDVTSAASCAAPLTE